MTFNRTTISKALATAVFATTLIGGASSALSQGYGEAHRGPGPHAGRMSEADREQMRVHFQERMNERLDRMGERLAIKPSQQDAWAEFRKTVQTMFQGRPERPQRDADAATLMRFRADMASQMASAMASLADATARLQQVLEPEQRKTLDEIARRFGRRGPHAGGPRHHGMSG
jgi:hypothetical protein